MADQEEMPKVSEGSATIRTSLSIYVPVFVIGWLLFEYLRRKHPLTFATRSRNLEHRNPIVDKDLTLGPFRWISALYNVSDDELVEYCGLDSMFFLRFLRMGQKMSLCVMLCSIILFPVYATGTHEEEKQRGIDLYERITMGNLHKNDPRIVASVIAAYIVTFYLLYLLQIEYKVYIVRRHEFLVKEDVQQYSVQIDYLPRNLRTRSTLLKYMQQLFPGQVRDVYVALECGQVEKDVSYRNKVKEKLEIALTKSAHTGQRPLLKVGGKCCCGGGEKIDAIDYYEQELQEFNKKVIQGIQDIEDKEKSLALSIEDDIADAPCVTSSSRGKKKEHAVSTDVDDIETLQESNIPGQAMITGIMKLPDVFNSPNDEMAIMRSTAFVSFTSIQACQMAKQLLQSEVAEEMHVCSVPDPRAGDMIWENLGIPLKTRLTWILASSVATAAIVFFWSIPTAGVATIASVEELKKNFPDLEKLIEDQRWVETVLQQVAPIALAIMSALAPIVFGILARKEGFSSIWDVNASLFSKLVYYQLVQTFFVTAIAGVFIKSYKEILNQPTKAVSILGATMPNQSVFFITLIIVQTGIGSILSLLRVMPVIFSWIHKVLSSKMWGSNHCEEEEKPVLIFKPITMPEDFDTTDILPEVLLTFLLMLSFSVIAPIIAFFTGFSFVVSEVLHRRDALCIHDSSPQSNGVFWPHLYKHIITCILIFHVIMIGLVSLKQFFPGTILCIILPVLTLLFNSYVGKLYPRTAQYLPLTICEKVDTIRKDRTVSAWSFLDDVFRQPAMKEKLNVKPDRKEFLDSPGICSPTYAGGDGTTFSQL